MSQVPTYAMRQGIVSSEIASGPLAAVVLLDFTESDDKDDSESQVEDTLANETVAGHGDMNSLTLFGNKTDSAMEWDEGADVWTGPAQVVSYQDAYESYAVFTSSGLTGFPYGLFKLRPCLSKTRTRLRACCWETLSDYCVGYPGYNYDTIMSEVIQDMELCGMLQLALSAISGLWADFSWCK
ncbi:hypothetical protein HDU77_008602 [Chytriomyces hyalinus]|nr:hypothetical protein HDU77_008602 [Chytriomyces hyalinus]